VAIFCSNCNATIVVCNVILEAGKPVMTTSRVPLNINYETDNCIVRELEVTDPLDVICSGWPGPRSRTD
jgi:hypothetical protein